MSARTQWHLTRQGLVVPTSGASKVSARAAGARAAPALNDEEAWLAQAQAVLSEWHAQPGMPRSADGSVDLLVDASLTLCGVLKGPMWTLSRSEVDAAARLWCEQQAGGGQWLISVAVQRDGQHAVVAAMPPEPLWGVCQALARADLCVGRVAPAWVAAVAPLEAQACVCAVVGLASDKDHPAWQLNLQRDRGAWQSLELEPATAASAAPSTASSTTNAGGKLELPRSCGADSVLSLDFRSPPAARSSRAARVVAAFLGTWAVAGLAALTVEAMAWRSARESLDTSPVPVQFVSAPARAPIPAPLLEAIDLELAKPWLPLLDSVARTRPMEIELQRVEPSVAAAGSDKMSLNISGQATEPSAVLAWMRKLEADPLLAAPRLSGWQSEGSGQSVAFQLEVSHGKRR